MKGVILAAGEGMRIRRVTYGGFPKELLPIGYIPTIRFPIEALRLAGINDIFVVIAPQTKHGIIDGLQSGRKLGVNICYVVQEKDKEGLTGLGQAILSTKPWVGNSEDFVVACGDSILCDFSAANPLDCLKPTLKFHASESGTATLIVHPTKSNPKRFGIVKFRRLHDDCEVLHGEVESLVEKPSLKLAKSFRTNGFNYIVAGYYIFRPKIFSYIEETKPGVKGEVQITDAIALALKSGEKVYAVVHGKNDGCNFSPFDYWDVGIPEDYKEANRRLSEANLEQLIALKE